MTLLFSLSAQLYAEESPRTFASHTGWALTFQTCPGLLHVCNDLKTSLHVALNVCPPEGNCQVLRSIRGAEVLHIVRHNVLHSQGWLSDRHSSISVMSTRHGFEVLAIRLIQRTPGSILHTAKRPSVSCIINNGGSVMAASPAAVPSVFFIQISMYFNSAYACYCLW